MVGIHYVKRRYVTLRNGDDGRPKAVLVVPMTTTSKSKRSRRCAHCDQPFQVDPRLGKRHRFCAATECVKIRQTKAHARWLKRNGGKSYYISHRNRERVTEWRENNPRYWQRLSRKKRRNHAGFVLSAELEKTLRYVALQDTIDTHLPLIIGLVSRISGSALQDTIAKEMNDLMIIGRGILTKNTKPGKRPRKPTRRKR